MPHQDSRTERLGGYGNGKSEGFREKKGEKDREEHIISKKQVEESLKREENN